MPPLESSENHVPDDHLRSENGILPIYEAFYLESIAYSAGRAVAAFGRFDEALARGERNGTIVANIHEALTHVGELSRFFWPARDNGISPARGNKLREAFGLKVNSPLKDRDLRNTLEHYDEKLDLYLKKAPTGQILPSSTIGMISKLPAPIRAFRLLDPQKSTFVILDEQYEFGTLRIISAEILKRATEMLDNGARLPE